MNIQIEKDGSLQQEDQATLKNYFANVIEMARTHEEHEFVVDLEDVWALAYARKDNSLRSLKKDFIEDEDYIVERVESGDRGRKEERYLLTLKCMEFLIARRVRPVFEIYRKVFHKSVNEVKVEDERVKLAKELRKGTAWLPNNYDNTPKELRDHDHGWFCLFDYGPQECFAMFASRAICERAKLSPAQAKVYDEMMMMGRIILCQRLLFDFRDKFIREGIGTWGDIQMTLKSLAYWRSWLEMYSFDGHRRPSPLAYDPSRCNLAKSIIFPYENFEKDFAPTYTVFSEM